MSWENCPGRGNVLGQTVWEKCLGRGCPRVIQIIQGSKGNVQGGEMFGCKLSGGKCPGRGLSMNYSNYSRGLYKGNVQGGEMFGGKLSGGNVLEELSRNY